ncbi:MAG: hypothetical protein EAZ77_16760 [Nostocales cyanobacterium]|nr:MAG: hypothetical protein EAZ77_16760 [Nostocales cyanobacterium]
MKNLQLNPLTDANQITPSVEARIDEIYGEFENIVKVEIERRLLEISNLRNSVPGEVHLCVDAAVEQ